MNEYRNYEYEIIKDCNGNDVKINKRTRFFIPMTKKYIPNFGLVSIGKTETFDLVECYIDESEYLLKFGDKNDRPFKITLTACDELYGRNTYHYDDFLSLIESGEILIKKNEFCKPISFKIINTIPNSCAILVSEVTEIIDFSKL